MSKRLLNRQVSLLDYLTSGAAIFGGGGGALDHALGEIDPGLLRLEARFSHEKRMEKIAAVFPKTFELLADNRAAMVQEFVEACPPFAIGRIENAQQFCDFLAARWRHTPLEPRYLLDVAACELACAKARVGAEDRQLVAENVDRDAVPESIRRHPGVVLVRCAHDIRPIFEGGSGQSDLPARDISLAIATPPGTNQPVVFELLPVAFDVLAALDDWTDPAAFGATPELASLIRDLAEHGLVETHR